MGNGELAAGKEAVSAISSGIIEGSRGAKDSEGSGAGLENGTGVPIRSPEVAGAEGWDSEEFLELSHFSCSAGTNVSVAGPMGGWMAASPSP